MAAGIDVRLAHEFQRRAAEARVRLRSRMDAARLFERDGWRISESVRDTAGGSQLVLRPMHLYEAAPASFECTVFIAEDGTSVDSECPDADPASEW